MFPYVENYDGYAVRNYMIHNVDIMGYLTFAYLALVWKAPGVIKSFNDKYNNKISNSPILNYIIIMWNLFLSTFSFFGMMVVVPAFMQRSYHKGIINTLCEQDDKMLYNSSVGFWIGAFVLSKIPELFDTVLLIFQGKNPPFLHWYHHTTVLIFSWHTYCIGISTMIIFAAMNLTVHFIMYLYFALCACGLKKTMRKIAPLITFLQILQMVIGSGVTLLSAYKVYFNNNNNNSCYVSKSSARMGVLMYLSYLYLFSVMFVKSYLTPKKTTTGGGVREGKKE